MNTTDSSERAVTVLAVDDEPLILELLGMALRAKGYVFIGLRDGQAAIDKLAAGFHPDIMILDLIMPEIDGFETCRQIRNRFPDIKAPIIFLTAKQSKADVEEALAAGGNDFLLKPFQVETILKRVEHWLKQG